MEMKTGPMTKTEARVWARAYAAAVRAHALHEDPWKRPVRVATQAVLDFRAAQSDEATQSRTTLEEALRAAFKAT